MEQIGFIGAMDKKDLLLNVANVLTSLNKNVLIVDSTTTQRLRYVVPRIDNAKGNTYISDYLGIDVALGFMNLNGIAQYLGQNLNYDYILVDSDNIQTVMSFMIPSFSKIFFVTSYDEYELQRGLEIARFLQKPIEVYKVIFSTNITSKEDAYLNYLFKDSAINWKNENVQFADTIIDRKFTLENQLSKQLTLKKFTQTYKDSLEYLTGLIIGEQVNQAEIKRIIKKI